MTVGNRVRHHRPLWEEVAAMHVADCLVWDIPKGKKPSAMSAALWHIKQFLPGVILRTNFHNRRMFIVRLA